MRRIAEPLRPANIFSCNRIRDAVDVSGVRGQSIVDAQLPQHAIPDFLDQAFAPLATFREESGHGVDVFANVPSGNMTIIERRPRKDSPTPRPDADQHQSPEGCGAIVDARQKIQWLSSYTKAVVELIKAD